MHRGRDAAYHALAQDFYWRGIGKATKRWVARCLECLKHKSANQQHGLIHPLFYDKPMNVLGIDFVGPFPESTNGNRYILTAGFPFSHFLIAVPKPDRSATTSARALFDNVFLTTVFVDTRLWKTKHPLKRFRNFRQSYMLLTYRCEIYRSPAPSMTQRRSNDHTTGCDWWISIRSVDTKYT